MKKILTIGAALSMSAILSAQSVPVAYTLSNQDLRGTARFMSMGGAFGALGGDLSCLSQNPGGIGVYRNSDVGVTFGLDAIQAETTAAGFSNTDSKTCFNLNNIGGVFTLKLSSETVPNLNFGFTYNKVASFNRRYSGGIPNLKNSMSNYIAGLCNADNLTEADVQTTNSNDPYNPSYGSKYVPWLSIMGYDAYLTDPYVMADGNTHWYGQFGEGTSGSGNFSVREKGYIDEYNIAIGGNIRNIVYWGIDFGVTTINYRIQSQWGESLQDAYVYNPYVGDTQKMSSNWRIYDNYKVNGNGINFKLGVIVKPIQELRIGFAFHTPTYYNLSETFYDDRIYYDYPFLKQGDFNSTWANDGFPAGNDFNFRTPWKIIASLAGVIANKVIVSADYEWNSYNGMRYSEADIYDYYNPYDDPWYGWDYYGDPYYAPQSRSGNYAEDFLGPNEYANYYIKQVYKNTSTIRLGAEFRALSWLSIRAGYSYKTSPVKKEAKNGSVTVPGTGVLSNYTLDNATQHVTCGLGFKHKGFYADLAYVYKYQSSEFYPFSPDIADPGATVKSKLQFNNSQIALSLGYRF